MNSSFEYALEARLHWMTVKSLQFIGGYDNEVLVYKERALQCIHSLVAWDQLYLCTPHYKDRIPAFFEGEEEAELRAHYFSYLQMYQHERQLEEEAHQREMEDIRQELAENEAEKARLEEVRTLIVQNKWAELGLPTPEELSEHLFSGKSIRIEGHFLDYEDGMTWLDNPYGIEGVLGEEPTPALCRSFLKRVAQGGMYGPEP